ncbi:GNAT family N-acetyltransferase [Acidithiobacillus sp.]
MRLSTAESFRTAVHSAHQGAGLGRLLMGCAVEHCFEARKTVAAEFDSPIARMIKR